jgi:hypothetical protein
MEYKNAKPKDAAEKVLKLGLNSFYGKTALRPTKGNLNPQTRELMWAGYMTAYARAQLMWYCKPYECSIISFMTDGIYGLAPCPVPEGEELGKYEIERHAEGIFILAGVYGVIINKEDLEKGKCACKTSMWKTEIVNAENKPYCKQSCTPECVCDNGCRCHWSYRIRGYADLNVHNIFEQIKKEI